MLLPIGLALAESTNSSPVEPKAAAYDRTLDERVTKIIAALNLNDAARSNRVHDIVVQQYRALSEIHLGRDVRIQTAKTGKDKTAANAAIQAARDEAKPKLDELHGKFLRRLSAELSPAQVDQVKDGMTYGVVPLTYGVYLKMYPQLTTEQQAQIKAWLTEARELAMDGSTSDEKHAVFGKYKGRINNYLSKAGYDAKQAEQNLKKPVAPGADAKSK